MKPDRVFTDTKCVVEEMLPRLDVVLVFIGPVEQNLFTVVRYCELLLRRVAAHTHEVPIVIVTREELVDVVEDLGLMFVPAGKVEQISPFPFELCD